MRNFLHHIIIILTLGTTVLTGSVAVALSAEGRIVGVDTSRVAVKEAKPASFQISDSEKRVQRSFFSSIRSFFPFRSSAPQQDAEKLLSSVKVFPNPVVDQISLSYRLGKESPVSIKVMDALGNEVMTLFNQELDAGPQTHAFETNGKLTNGFYFIRVAAGMETVVKRISVL